MKLCLAVVLASFFWALSSGQTQIIRVITMNSPPPAAAAPNDAAKPKAVFTPSVEAKLTEFEKKVAEAKRKLWGHDLDQRIAELQKVTGVDGPAVQALQAAGQQAADLALPGWSAKFDEDMREGYRAMSAGQMVASLDQMMPQAAICATQEMLGANTRPTDQAVWTDALRHNLSSAQYGAWDKVQLERQAAAEKEIAGYLDTQVDRMRQQYSRVMLVKSNVTARLLQWPKDRADALDALARSAADQAAAATRDGTKKALLAMPAEQRSQLIKGRAFYSVNEDGKGPEELPVWRDGFAKLVSADEQKILQAAEDERKHRRIRVLGQMLLALLDEKVAFTAAQRPQLQPLAERLVQTEPTLSPETNPQFYISFGLSTFYQTGAKATPADLQGVLDPVQCQRWQSIAQDETDDSNTSDDAPAGPRPAGAAGKTAAAADPGEPEETEQLISDFLDVKAGRKRKQLLSFMVLKAEDASRIDALPAEVGHRLRTAAEGAAEQTLTAWNANLEQSVRSQTQDATPQNVKLRLESVQDYMIQQNNAAPEETEVWKKTTQAELNSTQCAAWQKEIDARRLYRDTATIAFIMAEFDRQNPLTAEQWQKIEPLVTKAMNDYEPDFARMFSDASMRWYLLGYSMFLPFAAVPENDLKTALGKEQWEQWTGSNEFSMVSNYWGNIQTMHNQNAQRVQKVLRVK